MTDKDLLRSDRAALVEALTSAGATIRGNAVKCPFHNDAHPSGSIYESDSVWRFKCMACGVGGDILDIRALAGGTTPGDEIKKLAGPKPRKHTPSQKYYASLDGVREFLRGKIGQIENEYIYTSADGEYFETIFRCLTPGGKSFMPCHLTDGGYILKAPSKPWPLYNLTNVTQAETVVICEGEKCTDALTRYGFVATTSPGGSKNAKNADWSPLAGKKIILWPDCDAAGRSYAADVESILESLNPVPRISVLDPVQLDLAESEDVADFVSQLNVLNKTDAEITAAIADALQTAKTRSIAGEVRQRIADIRAGRYAAIPWPWPLIHNLTKALLPGERTLLVGSPGATKTFLTLQAFEFWMALGIKCVLFEAEQNRVYHLTRALAQKSGCAWLSDADIVKERADEADAIATEYSDFLDRFGRILNTTDSVMSLDEIAVWIEEKAKAGFRIIGVDPVTAFQRTGKPWEADDKFLRQVEHIARDYGCSVFMVTHCVKHVTGPDMSQVAGAASYERFTQTVLWLESHEIKTSTIHTPLGPSEYRHNRTIHILKANNGRGCGFRLAFDFDADNLTLSEIGLIRAKK